MNSDLVVQPNDVVIISNLDLNFDPFSWPSSSSSQNQDFSADEEAALPIQLKVDLSSYDLEQQPEFHENLKSVKERICSKCMMNPQDLSSREIKYYYLFREELIHPYDQDNQQHEHQLTLLYYESFKTMDTPERLMSDEWLKLGFQNKNPRTDFRGSGYLGLLSLRFFLTRYPQEADLMKEDIHINFFIALTCFKITHFLMAYLYLNKDEVSDELKILRASRIQIKNFCRINAENKNALFEIQAFMLRYQNLAYQRALLKPFKNFDQLLEDTKILMNKLLGKDNFTTTEELKRNFQQCIVKEFGQCSMKAV